ncbi:MAG TPA: PilZ domain-containing protein [Candidatus Dormibacteraeota bacterium]|nr:PilZ domain-containing protein [Candidatus Dormibacteraeota bacterium]
MKLFQALGFKRKPSPAIRRMLPKVNTWVELHYGASATFDVCVEHVDDDSIVTSRPEAGRMRQGAAVAIVFTTTQGKYRFGTRLVGEDARGHLRFAIPESVGIVGGGEANQRSALRMDATLPGMWRMAAGGKGVGQFDRATVRDISRGGLALTLPCELRNGLEIEVQVPLGSAPPVQVVCEVMRVDRIEGSAKFSHGVRFRNLSPAGDRTISEFINRRQVDLRARGLA